MPCVFPVLSMKALNLVQSSANSEHRRIEGVLYLLGVLACFLGLAATMIALRQAGASIGWGFQLQSPPVVASFALLMLLVGLNMSGVFDVGATVQGSTRAAVGAFGAGALAVAVAAPCTAPFMATALGWAIAQPAIIVLAVFASLALGFALPLTSVCFLPALSRALPRPGPWMERFREVLAFPMYGAAAWLTWVFTLQTHIDGLPLFLSAAVTLSMAAWLFGRAQRSRKPLSWSVSALAAMLAALGMTYAALNSPPPRNSAFDAQPWSGAAQQRLLGTHAPVFVEFTAAWCVTCQVNDAAVLSDPAVRAALQKERVAYLRADLTSFNGQMFTELAAHGRAGVPLYLVYGASGRAVTLPQILDKAAVLSAINSARAS